MTGRRWISWAVAVALLVAAGVVKAITPGDDAPFAPFVVTAAMGDPAVGRDLSVTVVDAQRADRVVTPDRVGIDGDWLVVELDVAAVRSEGSFGMSGAFFAIDGRTYTASERFDSLVDAPLAIDLLRRGQVAFELAPDIDGGTGTLSFALDEDMRLDSEIEVPLDLDDLDRVAEVDIGTVEWVSP